MEESKMLIGSDRKNEGANDTNDQHVISWEDFLKMIPVYTVTLLVFEACKQYYYYKLFNLNISNYLNISDLFNSFLGTISKYIVSLIIFGGVINFISFFFGSRRIMDKMEDNKNNKNEDAKPPPLSLPERKKLHRIMIAKNLAIFFLIYGTAMSIIYFWIKVKYPLLVEAASIIVYASVSIYILFQYEAEIEKLNIPESFIAYVVVSYVVLVFYMIISFREGYFLMTNAANRNTAIEFASDSIYNNQKILPAHDSRYYIGRTSEFYFIYNEKDSSTTAINKDDIKNFASYSAIIVPQPDTK